MSDAHLQQQNAQLAAAVGQLQQQLAAAYSGPPTRVVVAMDFVALVRNTTPLLVVATDNGPRPFTKKETNAEQLASDAAYDLLAQYFMGKVTE